MATQDNTVYRNGILDPASSRAKRGAFSLILFSIVVFFTPLFYARFLWAGVDKSPNIHYGIWIVLTVLMLVSWLPSAFAVKAAYRGDNGGVAKNFGFSTLIALAMVVGIIIEWATGHLGIGTRFGENVYTDAAAFALMFVCGLIAFAAHTSKAIRGKQVADEAWKVHNIANFWQLMILLWIVFFVLYFII